MEYAGQPVPGATVAPSAVTRKAPARLNPIANGATVEAMSKQSYGWVVEVVEGGNGALARVRQFHVAVPGKTEAEQSVRRRIPGAAAGTVTATTMLSRHEIYGVLRLKRGAVTEIV